MTRRDSVSMSTARDTISLLQEKRAAKEKRRDPEARQRELEQRRRDTIPLLQKK